ncbi:MAG TPA: hypothetical protein VLX91_00340 [Candidatus Acidoferrales bacterium]|nr:hypothetical protein [Candidatus Acidoferrales bacterium]
MKKFDVTGISAETKDNGYVVKLSAVRKIESVEAWIGDDNWLYITIPDTSVDLDQIGRLRKNPIIERMECFFYHASVQICLQLKEKVEQLDIVRYRDENDVYIALYRIKQ